MELKMDYTVKLFFLGVLQLLYGE